MKKTLYVISIIIAFFTSGERLFAQITNYTIQAEKTYQDNTRICYFEINDTLSKQQKRSVMEQAQSNVNLFNLHFYDDNEYLAMFHSVVEWNLDSVVNFINEVLTGFPNKIHSFSNIQNYVGGNSQSVPSDPCSGALNQPNGCIDAAPFCTSDQYCFAASINIADGGSIGCLSATPNPAWYWMEIDQPGSLQITIEQRNMSNVLVDVDFIAWGPFLSVAEACAQRDNIPGSNNHYHMENYPNGNIVDCCYCTSGTESLHINNAQTGEVYLLLLTNYSNEAANISFSKTGGTATANCGVVTPPTSNNGPLCLGDTLQLSAQASSIAGAVYNWTGPNGFMSNLQNPTIPDVTTADAGAYTLTITTGAETGSPETTVVVINEPSNTTYLNDTICSNALPYNKNGFTDFLLWVNIH